MKSERTRASFGVVTNMPARTNDVEIGESVSRGEMIEGAAQTFGEENRGARAGDVGAQSCDDGKFRGAQNSGCMLIGVFNWN